MRDASSPKMLCKLGRIGSALDWANVRRLVAGEQPEGQGAIASAEDDDDKSFVTVNASPQETRSDRANRRTTDLRVDQGNA